MVAPDWWLQEIRSDSVGIACRDERRVSVARVLAEVGPHGEFEYRYDMLLWVGGVFDPGGFDLNRLNRDYKRAKGRRR